MFRLLLVLALLGVSMSPLDAREPPRKDAPAEGRGPSEPRRDIDSELRRDVERISKEIYAPTRGSWNPAPTDGRRSPPGRR